MGVKVRKLGFLGLEMVKHEEVFQHYAEVIGLPVAERTASELHMGCGTETALRLYRGERSGHRSVGLIIDGEGPLEDAVKALGDIGVKGEIKSDLFPDIGACIEVADDNGYAVYLYRQPEAAPPVPYSNSGIQPDKLGHVAMFVEDARKTAQFYTDVLGFRWSDWLGDFFVFMRCNIDHHTMNFINSPKKGMFHVAFELRDLSHLGRSADILVRNRIPILWGPGRHGIGHNLFTYHKDPDGNIVELIADLDRMASEELGYYEPRPYHDSFPQRPRVWSPDDVTTVNLWGAPPPPGFLE